MEIKYKNTHNKMQFISVEMFIYAKCTDIQSSANNIGIAVESSVYSLNFNINFNAILCQQFELHESPFKIN